MAKETKTIEQAVEAIKAIQAEYAADVIKDYEIPPLVNTKTGETIGFAVVMQLSTKYDYDGQTFSSWQKRLQADDWYINVKRNQLHIHFKVRYKDV